MGGGQWVVGGGGGWWGGAGILPYKSNVKLWKGRVLERDLEMLRLKERKI